MTRNAKSFAIAECVGTAYHHSGPVVGVPVVSGQGRIASARVTTIQSSAFALSSSPSPGRVRYFIAKCHFQSFLSAIQPSVSSGSDCWHQPILSIRYLTA